MCNAIRRMVELKSELVRKGMNVIARTPWSRC